MSNRICLSLATSRGKPIHLDTTYFKSDVLRRQGEEGTNQKSRSFHSMHSTRKCKDVEVDVMVDYYGRCVEGGRRE